MDWTNERICVKKSLYKGNLQEPKSDLSKRDIDMGPRMIEVLKAHKKRQIEPFLKIGKQLSNDDFFLARPTEDPLIPITFTTGIFRESSNGLG